MSTPVFASTLPPEKSAPQFIKQDQEHLSQLAANLAEQEDDLRRRLSERRTYWAHEGQELVERDAEIRRMSSRLAPLSSYGIDLALGRMVPEPVSPTAPTTEPVYVGRIGILDEDGNPLLVDWRTPAAEPFFAATHANPMGLVSRRRYRWTGDLISDFWDEVFSPEALSHEATLAASALDDQSSFIASLDAARTDTMRDVLATIAADQDAVIRADARGPLVVSGGPGTGKTVVALHRAAYLMYKEPRLRERRGGVLFVGPHHPYTTYISSVLPSLGEEDVQVATLADLVPLDTPTSIERINDHPSDGSADDDQASASLKADARWTAAIDSAIAFYESPPTSPISIDTPWADLTLMPADWAEAFASLPVSTAHNEALGLITQTLVDILVDQASDLISDDSQDSLRSFLSRSPLVRREVSRVWPILSAEDIVADLWDVPAFLRLAAPWLTPEERAVLRAAPRPEGTAFPFTAADLPLVDAARFRLGDPEAASSSPAQTSRHRPGTGVSPTSDRRAHRRRF